MFEDAAPPHEEIDQQQQLILHKETALGFLQEHVDNIDERIALFTQRLEAFKQDAVANRVPEEDMEQLNLIIACLMGTLTPEDLLNFYKEANQYIENNAQEQPVDNRQTYINRLKILACKLNIYLKKLEDLAKHLGDLDPLTQDSFESCIDSITDAIQDRNFHDNVLTTVYNLNNTLQAYYPEDIVGSDDEDHWNALPPTEDALGICGECDLLQEA